MKNILIIATLGLISSIASAQQWYVVAQTSPVPGKVQVLLPSNVLTTNGGQTINGVDAFNQLVTTGITVSTTSPTGIWFRADGSMVFGTNFQPIATSEFTFANNGSNYVSVLSSGDTPGISCRRCEGTFAAPTATANAKTIAQYVGSGHNGSTWTGARGSLAFVTTESWTTANQGAYGAIYATPTNTAALARAMLLGYPGIVAGYTHYNQSDYPLYAPAFIENNQLLPYWYQTKMTSNTTITVSSSSQLRTAVNALPKNLGAYTLTIQFPASSLTWTTNLYLSGFYNGVINILGADVTSGSAYTTQTSVLTFTNSATATTAFVIENVVCPVTISDIAFKSYVGGGVYPYSILLNSLATVVVKECYFVHNATTNGAATIAQNGPSTTMWNNYFNGGQFGGYAYGPSCLYMTGNNYTGTRPAYGHAAQGGGYIGRADATVIGTTDNYVATGGRITTSAGQISP